MYLKYRKHNIPLAIGVVVVLVLSFITYNKKAEIIQADFEQWLQTLDLGYSSPQSLATILANALQIARYKTGGQTNQFEIERVDIDIPFLEYKKLMLDREAALDRGVLYRPTDVRAKILYDGERIKAKIRLKGDLADHWLSQYRTSLRVSLKGSHSIKGFKKFSLHKPGSRQHPFDQVYSEMLKDAGILSSTHSYINVFVNGMDWGVMNIEEHMSTEFLEKQKRKESLIVRFGDEEKDALFSMKDIEKTYSIYRLSDPQLSMKTYTKDSYKQQALQRKRITYIMQERLKPRHSHLYDIKDYTKSLILANIWNDGHPLYYINLKHYFNPYTLQLQPIPTDSSNPIPIREGGFLPRKMHDPFINNIIYKNIVHSREYRDTVEEVFNELKGTLKKVKQHTLKYTSYFPLDYPVDIYSTLLSNAKTLTSLKERRFYPDPAGRFQHNTERSALVNPARIYAAHNTDGAIAIYNFVPETITLSQIRVNGEVLADLDAKLPPYQPYLFSPSYLQTPFKGVMTNKIELQTRYNNRLDLQKVSPTREPEANIIPSRPQTFSEYTGPSDKILASLKEHLHARHFLDGHLEVYNLLHHPVYLTDVLLDGASVNKMSLQIPGFKAGDYSPTVIKTNLTGAYDNRISVQTRYQNFMGLAHADLSLDASGLFNPLLAQTEIKKSFLESQKNGSWRIKKGSWTIDKPLRIFNDLHIDPGVTLTFSEDAYLLVKGAILANGTSNEPIILKAEKSSWKGVYIMQSDGPSQLRHVSIHGARELTDGLLFLTGGVTFYRANVLMSDVHITESYAEDALNLVESSYDLNNMTIAGARSDGIDFDFSEGRLRNSTFNNIGGDAVDFSGTTSTIEDITFSNIKDKAISAGEESNIDIKSVTIRDVGVGIASKDGSTVTGTQLSIESAGLAGIMSYQKKDFYPVAKVNLTDVTHTKTNTGFTRQKGSFMLINNVEIQEKKLDVDSLYKNEIMGK